MTTGDHVIRVLRIFGPCTYQDLCQRLPLVPFSTLYDVVGVLCEAKLARAVSGRQLRFDVTEAGRQVFVRQGKDEEMCNGDDEKSQDEATAHRRMA